MTQGTCQLKDKIQAEAVLVFTKFVLIKEKLWSNETLAGKVDLTIIAFLPKQCMVRLTLPANETCNQSSQ